MFITTKKYKINIIYEESVSDSSSDAAGREGSERDSECIDENRQRAA